MANKNVVVTEPVTNDIVFIQIQLDGSGSVTLLKGEASISTDDNSTKHKGSFEFDVSSLPAAAQTAVTNLVAECLPQVKSDHGFV